MAEFRSWLLARRMPRIVLMAVLFPIPVMAIASAAIVAATASSHGWRVAAADACVSAALLMALTVLAGGAWFEIVVGAGVTWAIAAGLGQLRKVGSLNLAVQSSVLMGFIGALVFTLWSRDPHAYWEGVLRDLLGRVRAAGVDVGPDDVVPMAAQLMTGTMSASAVVSALGALFLGCWWSGGTDGRSFSAEFQGLRMGRVLGVLAGVVGLLALTGLRPSVDDLLLVLGVGFVVQGLAVIHWQGARRAWPRAWPLAVYLPALVPALAVLELLGLALLGLVDNGYSLRRESGKVV